MHTAQAITVASPSSAPTQPPATVTPSPTTGIQQVAQAAIPASPKLIPTVTPTSEPDALVDTADEGEAATSEATEVVVDATAAANDPGSAAAQGSLAVAILDEGWADAIHTRDGGVMGIVSSNELNIRSAPSAAAEIVDITWIWHPVVIYDAVHGDWVGETDIWYALGVEEYISAAFVVPFVAALPSASHAGTWVDVNIATGYAVAYDGAIPVYATMVAYGKPGFETPLGEHTVFARVESDTLDSATVGIPDGDAEAYRLTDVPHVQYFAEGGFALHANYWDETWELGGPTSHGCINLTPAAAAWFWNFLELGSFVSVHE